jgi:hypothetical protein
LKYKAAEQAERGEDQCASPRDEGCRGRPRGPLAGDGCSYLRVTGSLHRNKQGWVGHAMEGRHGQAAAPAVEPG